MKIRYQGEGYGTLISVELDMGSTAYESVIALARIMKALEYHESSIADAMQRYADENTPATPGDIIFDFEEDN